MTQTDYRFNRQIRIPEVRLIDQTGAQIGVVATLDAMRRAEEVGLDLVEVSPNERPPVCRIMDYGKFKYAQRKKERGTHAKASLLKELRVRPAIDEHDLGYRLDQGRKFLEDGHKVQVVCAFSAVAKWRTPSTATKSCARSRRRWLTSARSSRRRSSWADG